MLPLTLRYLCPRPVAIVGIGTLAAAVMSSADSSILSSATVFTNNIYRNALRSQVRQAKPGSRHGVLDLNVHEGDTKRRGQNCFVENSFG